MTEHVLQLKDSRKLSYAFYGPLHGQPVLYFHGTPSSRLELLLLKNYNIDLEQLLENYSIRLIAIDRPGMGLSDYNPNGNFTSFANDVNQLTAYLNTRRCKVLCWSGGGTFALAAAYHLPQLIQQVYIVTGFSRSFSETGVFTNMNGNKYYFWSAKNIPGVMRGIMNFVGKKEASKPIPRWLSQLPTVDHELLDKATTIQHISKVTLCEACRRGSRGLVHEAALYFKETGYTLDKIVQPVHFWWGLKDNTVTQVHPKAVENQVAGAVMHYKQNEGHLSIFVNWIEEVLETIELD